MRRRKNSDARSETVGRSSRELISQSGASAHPAHVVAEQVLDQVDRGQHSPKTFREVSRVPGGFGGMGGGGALGPDDIVTQSDPPEDADEQATLAELSDEPGPPPQRFFEPTPVLARQVSLGQSAGGDQVFPAQRTGGIEPVRLLAPFMRLPSTSGESPGEGWIQKGPRGNWFYPQTGQTLSPDLNHGGPKGPHFDLQRRGSGKLSLRMFEDELQFYLESGDVWLPIEALPMVP